jgi:hypothetical protein
LWVLALSAFLAGDTIVQLRGGFFSGQIGVCGRRGLCPERRFRRGAMTKTTSFQMDFRPLFTERDIQGMSKAFNLGSYDDVKKHAGAIYDRIRGIGGAVGSISD